MRLERSRGLYILLITLKCSGRVRRGAQSGGSALPGLITEKLAVVVDFMVNYLSARWKMASGRCQLPTTTADWRLATLQMSVFEEWVKSWAAGGRGTCLDRFMAGI